MGRDPNKIPAVKPPTGMSSNFINPPSQSLMVTVFAIVTLPPMIVLLVLRFYARVKISGIGLDDYFCGLAAAVIVVYVGLCLAVIEVTEGRHMWDVPSSWITIDYAQKGTALTNTYYLAAMLAKTTLLIQYKRIFRPSRLANLLLWAGIVFNIVFYLVCIIILLAYCVPRKEDYPFGGWHSHQFAVRCSHVDGYILLVCGVMGTVIDVYVLAIPLSFLWGLKTTVKKKAGLSALFIAGSAAVILSVVGIVYRVKVASPHHATQDLTWNTIPIYAAGIGELTLGIACSCMPVVFILFQSFTIWSQSLFSKLRYRASSRRRQSQLSDINNINALEYQNIDQNSLPRVPKGTMTDVRFFMRNLGRTIPVYTTKNQTDMLSVDSLNCDYHEQLKSELEGHKPYPSQSHTANSGSIELQEYR